MNGPVDFDTLPIVEDKLPTFEDGPKTKELRALLYKLMKIELKDGRELIGVFSCFDKDKNIMLADCKETRAIRPMPVPEDQTEQQLSDVALQKYFKLRSEGKEVRQLGLVLVPGAHVATCHIDENPAYVPPEFRKQTEKDADAEAEAKTEDVKTEVEDDKKE